MNYPRLFTASISLGMQPLTALAEEVKLPAPVLEWSFYMLLIFAIIVAFGIFFKRGKDKRNESMGELFEEHHTTVHSVSPDISVTECVRQLNEQRIGAMLVIENERLCGIFTERDAVTKVLGAGLEPSTTCVSAVMTKNPICITPATTLDEAMAIVSHQRIRHLPVARNGNVMGMVSAGDLTHWLVEDRSGEIRELVDIAGNRRNPR
jgi:CBS domain-containing protein